MVTSKRGPPGPAPGAVNLPEGGVEVGGVTKRKDQQDTEPSSQQNSDYYASELKNATFRSLEDLLGVREISLKSSDLALTDNVGLNRGNSIKSELKYMFRDTVL